VAFLGEETIFVCPCFISTSSHVFAYQTCWVNSVHSHRPLLYHRRHCVCECLPSTFPWCIRFASAHIYRSWWSTCRNFRIRFQISPEKELGEPSLFGSRACSDAYETRLPSSAWALFEDIKRLKDDHVSSLCNSSDWRRALLSVSHFRHDRSTSLISPVGKRNENRRSAMYSRGSEGRRQANCSAISSDLEQSRTKAQHIGPWGDQALQFLNTTQEVCFHRSLCC